jgi:hypothetical protein
MDSQCSWYSRTASPHLRQHLADRRLVIDHQKADQGMHDHRNAQRRPLAGEGEHLVREIGGAQGGGDDGLGIVLLRPVVQLHGQQLALTEAVLMQGVDRNRAGRAPVLSPGQSFKIGSSGEFVGRMPA